MSGTRRTEHNVRVGKGKYQYLLRSFNLSSIEAVKENRNWKYFEKLRQWADKRMVRYDSFWAIFFNEALKCNFSKMWIQVIASSKFMLGRIKKEVVSRRKAGVIETSDSILFLAINYKGHQVQNDYYSYIFYSCKAKYGPRVKERIVELVKEGLISRKYFVYHKRQDYIGRLFVEIAAATEDN